MQMPNICTVRETYIKSYPGLLYRSRTTVPRKLNVWAVTAMDTAKFRGREGRDLLYQYLSLTSVLFHAHVYMKLLLLPEDGRAAQLTQQSKSPFSRSLYK
jgi:hypothetical protein